MNALQLEAPGWFRRAIGVRPEFGDFDADGTRIRYRAWGPVDSPGIVLVHGGAAHSGWWDHVAPFLALERRVVALDLSGHGDSDRRQVYDMDLWAREVLQAGASQTGILGHPMLVGHSMGGFVSLIAAGRFGDDLRGVIAIDSPVRDLTSADLAARHQRATSPLRVYPTRRAAVEAFHPVPHSGSPHAYVVAHLAESSMCSVPGGWRWKFDPGIFRGRPMSPDRLGSANCPIVLIRGEHGLLSEEVSDAMTIRLGSHVQCVELPDAAHHVMLDQPLALVAALRALMETWGQIVSPHDLSHVPGH